VNAKGEPPPMSGLRFGVIRDSFVSNRIVIAIAQCAVFRSVNEPVRVPSHTPAYRNSWGPPRIDRLCLYALAGASATRADLNHFLVGRYGFMETIPSIVAAENQRQTALVNKFRISEHAYAFRVNPSQRRFVYRESSEYACYH